MAPLCFIFCYLYSIVKFCWRKKGSKISDFPFIVLYSAPLVLYSATSPELYVEKKGNYHFAEVNFSGLGLPSKCVPNLWISIYQIWYLISSSKTHIKGRLWLPSMIKYLDSAEFVFVLMVRLDIYFVRLGASLWYQTNPEKASETCVCFTRYFGLKFRTCSAIKH